MKLLNSHFFIIPPTFRSLNEAKANANKAISKLDALSPLKTLLRGYSIVEKDGKVVKKVEDVNINDELKIRVSNGNINTKVVEKVN